jgi:hypothetical protein
VSHTTRPHKIKLKLQIRLTLSRESWAGTCTVKIQNYKFRNNAEHVWAATRGRSVALARCFCFRHKLNAVGLLLGFDIRIQVKVSGAGRVGGATDVNHFLSDSSASISPYLTPLSAVQAARPAPNGRTLGEGTVKDKSFPVYGTNALHWFLTAALDLGEWSVSSPSRFIPRGRAQLDPLNWR